jgi:ABC-2 type transport system permease protein
MSVYKRSYRGYAGVVTPTWSRFLILTRYAWQGLFRSRLLTGIFIVSLFPFLVETAMIYINHNTSFLSLIRVNAGTHLLDINATFFRNCLQIQISFAFILTAFVGPGLVSPDLTNNALPLYFCRPFTRSEYVLGKFLVLLRLLSFITWVPGIALFAIEAGLSGWSWTMSNVWIAGAIVLDSAICMLVVSLLALALSAWVKWKPVAGGLFLAVLFLGAGMGAAVNAVIHTRLGDFISIGRLLSIVAGSVFQTSDTGDGISAGAAWLGLLAISAFLLWLLSKKVRAYEVIR